jgi:hypothetical protein
MNDRPTGTFDVRIWKIEVREDRQAPFRVRWVVAGQRFGESFVTYQLADAYRSQLVTATKNGERFDLGTGLPESLLRTITDISFLQHAQEFTAYAWKDAAAKSRISIIETLSRVVPVVTRSISGAPDPDILRAALRKSLNQGDYAPDLDAAETRAMAWLAKASRPVSAFSDESVVWDVLDAIATKLDGKPAAPDYFARRRRVMHRVLGHADECLAVLDPRQRARRDIQPGRGIFHPQRPRLPQVPQRITQPQPRHRRTVVLTCS